MWPFINQLLNSAVSGWLWAFQGFPPIVQFCALALPVAILALMTYRYASNQKGIHAVKNRLKAFLLELRLFQDDLAVTLRAQGQILKNSVIYTGYALAPMSIMLVPIILILVQVESRYAFRALESGESTIVEATVDSPTPVSDLQAALILPPGLVCETPALRLDDQQKILWRVRAQRPGDYEMRIRIDGREFPKKVLVGVAGLVSPAIYTAGDIRTLAYPLEPALEKGSILSSVVMSYPRSRPVFAGLSSASWILFAASLVFGYVLRGVFGVTF